MLQYIVKWNDAQLISIKNANFLQLRGHTSYTLLKSTIPPITAGVTSLIRTFVYQNLFAATNQN